MRKTEQKAIDLVNDLEKRKDWQSFLVKVSYYSAFFGYCSRLAREYFTETLIRELEFKGFKVSR